MPSGKPIAFYEIHDSESESEDNSNGLKVDPQPSKTPEKDGSEEAQSSEEYRLIFPDRSSSAEHQDSDQPSMAQPSVGANISEVSSEPEHELVATEVMSKPDDTCAHGPSSSEVEKPKPERKAKALAKQKQHSVSKKASKISNSGHQSRGSPSKQISKKRK